MGYIGLEEVRFFRFQVQVALMEAARAVALFPGKSVSTWKRKGRK